MAGAAQTQQPKKAKPWGGMLVLLVLGASVGGIFWYQFVYLPSLPPPTPPVTRIFHIKGVIQEAGGWRILNETIIHENGAREEIIIPVDDPRAKKLSAIRGDNVTIFVDTEDSGLSEDLRVGHGFGIPDLNIDVRVPFTEVARVTFIANRRIDNAAGIQCTVVCSPRHTEMQMALSIS